MLSARGQRCSLFGAYTSPMRSSVLICINAALILFAACSRMRACGSFIRAASRSMHSASFAWPSPVVGLPLASRWTRFAASVGVMARTRLKILLIRFSSSSLRILRPHRRSASSYSMFRCAATAESAVPYASATVSFLLLPAFGAAASIPAVYWECSAVALSATAKRLSACCSVALPPSSMISLAAARIAAGAVRGRGCCAELSSIAAAGGPAPPAMEAMEGHVMLLLALV